MNRLTHTNKTGKAKMADVSAKKETLRTAKARAEVILGRQAFEAVKHNKLKKGDVFAVSNISAIQAAKKTYELIPLCHNIFISDIKVIFKLNEKQFTVEIISEVKSTAKTGVEMEALTAVSVAALTIYDMCKAVHKGILIDNIHLVSKTGGKSGDYHYGR